MNSHVIVGGAVCADPSVMRKKLCGENEGLIKRIPPLIICHVKATNTPTEKIIKSTANPSDIPIKTFRYIKRDKPPSNPTTVSAAGIGSFWASV